MISPILFAGITTLPEPGVFGTAPVMSDLPDLALLSEARVPPDPNGVFPETFAPGEPWEMKDIAPGLAAINLGSGHRLLIDEGRAAILVADLVYGHTTEVFADGAVALGGEHAYRFWGTTTFLLEGCAKVTFVTTLADAEANRVILDRVLVTMGERAVEIAGLANAAQGDLAVHLSAMGWSKDFETPDNFLLEQQRGDGAWLLPSGETASQEALMQTMPGAEYGPATPRPSRHDLRKLVSFHLTGMVGQNLGDLAGSLSEEQRQSDQSADSLRLSDERAERLAFELRRTPRRCGPGAQSG